MATINREAAEKLAKEGGRFYAVVRYQNRLRIDEGADPYNPDAENSGFDYAIVHNRLGYEAILGSPIIGGVDILASSKKFQTDERKRVNEKELAGEPTWAEIVATNPQIFNPTLGEAKSHPLRGKKKKHS